MGFFSPVQPLAHPVNHTPDPAQYEIYQKFDDLLNHVPRNHFVPLSAFECLLDKYTPAELQLIYQDLQELQIATFAHVTTHQKDYLVTAGGPASGKSTLLESLIDQENTITRAYIDPDRAGLQKMQHTYLHDVDNGIRTSQQAYEHWREASNYIAHYFLAIALDQGFPIAHGNTMSTNYSISNLEKIRDTYLYHTTLIHLTCAEDIRNQSEQFRQEGGLVQCTPEDFQGKQVFFFSLLPDYLKVADKVEFYFRGSMDTIIHAATYENKALTIHHENALKEIQHIHDQQIHENYWEETLQSHLAS